MVYREPLQAASCGKRIPHALPVLFCGARTRNPHRRSAACARNRSVRHESPIGSHSRLIRILANLDEHYLVRWACPCHPMLTPSM